MKYTISRSAVYDTQISFIMIIFCQAQSVLTAKGEDRKLHSFAAAVREANFLGRHAVDLSVREERMRQLRHHW